MALQSSNLISQACNWLGSSAAAAAAAGLSAAVAAGLGCCSAGDSCSCSPVHGDSAIFPTSNTAQLHSDLRHTGVSPSPHLPHQRGRQSSLPPHGPILTLEPPILLNFATQT
jgi:hypothetical protein